MMAGLKQARISSTARCLSYASGNFALSSSRGEIMPSLADAIARFAESHDDLKAQNLPPLVAAE
jgi:hypothetical protein